MITEDSGQPSPREDGGIEAEENIRPGAGAPVEEAESVETPGAALRASDCLDL